MTDNTELFGHTRKVARELTTGLRDDLALAARGWRWGRRPLVPRSAEPWTPAREDKLFPSSWSRTMPARAIREVLQKGALEPALRRSVQVRVNGLDVLDSLTGPVVFVANHTSHLDTPLILCTVPERIRRRTAVAAAADYFFDTWWRATASCLIFNVFPIERRASTLSAKPADLLADGWNILIFPEGTRSMDGWARPFKLAPAFIAFHAGVPVVPVSIRGSFAAMPRGRNWPVPGRRPVTVRYGEPVVAAPGETVRDFGPRVEAAVAQLTDEDSSTWWAAQRRAADGRTPKMSGPEASSWRRRWAATEVPEVPGTNGRRKVWGD